MPLDFDDMRGADTSFVERLAESSTSHSFRTSLITPTAYARRLEPALQELGVWFETTAPTGQVCFGQEFVNHHRPAGGFSRTWYVERLPGIDLAAGCIFRLLPPQLPPPLPSHPPPLPLP